MALESTTSSLFFYFLLSLFFWQLLKKSLCHFQPFCFHPAKPQLCKPWLPPLSIFGAPIHQRQGTGVRAGKETLQIQGTSSAAPSPRILVEMCQGGAWPQRFSSCYSFIDYLLECIKSLTFPSDSSWIFSPSVMNTLCFCVWLLLWKRWIHDNQDFLGIVGHCAQLYTGFVIPDASQQQGIFM